MTREYNVISSLFITHRYGFHIYRHRTTGIGTGIKPNLAFRPNCVNRLCQIRKKRNANDTAKQTVLER